jgi:hypothetical protein
MPHTTTTRKPSRLAFYRTFRRSRRGNLYTHYNDASITIFRWDGGWKFVIAKHAGAPFYSSQVYETEIDAMDDLMDHLE